VTTLPVQDPALPTAAPRRLSRKPTGADRAFVLGSRSIGALVLVLIGGIGVFLAWQSVPTLERYGWSFFTESAWQPEADLLGIAGVLAGTVSVAAVALIVNTLAAMIVARSRSGAAILSYNHSVDHLRAVHTAAEFYGT
jgi:phosphate transport system permease protein